MCSMTRAISARLPFTNHRAPLPRLAAVARLLRHCRAEKQQPLSRDQLGDGAAPPATRPASPPFRSREASAGDGVLAMRMWSPRRLSGTAFDPDNIAELFWTAHTDPAGAWQTEYRFTGA